MNPPVSDAFLRACRGEPVARLPVWYMRQAGRYQPEYRAIKATRSLMDIVHDPALCTEVTLLPVRQLDVDAAILFSDIMTPLAPMGFAFEIRDGVGPVLADPIRTPADLNRLRAPDFAAELPYVTDTIRHLRAALTVPLIGFCGAPFTLACYLVEGGPSKHYARVKSLMIGQPETWHHLLATLATRMADYLVMQADAGAQALQVFDSWAGQLDREDYARYVEPHTRTLFQELRRRTSVPLLYFGVGTGHLLESFRTLGAHVIGLDWRTDPIEARNRLGPDLAIQGNLDPGLLVGDWWPEIEARAARLLAQTADRPGFIFNLGHGVLPQTSPAMLRRLTDFVHAWPLPPQSSAAAC